MTYFEKFNITHIKENTQKIRTDYLSLNFKESTQIPKYQVYVSIIYDETTLLYAGFKTSE